MLADEPTLRPGLYRLPDEPVAQCVLVPAFRSATSVRGAFGWFSAGWIEKLAPGLAEYLNRSDTAPITFTVAPALFAPEQEAIERANNISADEAAQLTADVFVNGRMEASALAAHALDCLAWMIATERLRLRIAVPEAESNYHPKIWLFEDETHRVLARGSGNATRRGVASGVEHLDVDVSWIEHSQTRVRTGIKILEDWSSGHSSGIRRVVELPEALEQDIIRTAPDVAPSCEDYAKAVIQDMNPPWASNLLETLKVRFAHRRNVVEPHPRLRIPAKLEWRTGPFSHQGEAVEAWESGATSENGIISMATGAGKTITALICATRVQDRQHDRPLLVVISAPSIPLIDQWRKEVLKFGITAIAPSLERNPNQSLTNLFRGLRAGGTHIVIVTNRLLCSSDFQSTVKLKIQGRGAEIGTLFIADEAHTLGAKGFISNTPDFFKRRLALSATPERQYDPDGTEEVFSFFGGSVYDFGLDKAIGFCLSPYNYYVHATTLDDDELDKFHSLTSRIRRLVAIGAEDDEEKRTSLLIARRRIIETAKAKLSLLRAVLKRRGCRSLTQTLIYASAKNPEQFDSIATMLTQLDIRWAPVTQKTTANRKLLKQTLETFENGGYQVLLAKKVLDEGVDIPSIREAFIVASSTVEREWIQRRGRVLRKHPDKPWAIIHDFLALPPARLVTSDGTSDMKKIIRKELGRAYSFAAHARNATDDDGVIADLQNFRSTYWPDGDYTTILQHAGDHIIAAATPEGTPW